jgi:hypothetical protein
MLVGSVGVGVVRKKFPPSPKVERTLTRRVSGELSLARLETFSDVLVERDKIIIREDDWNV